VIKALHDAIATLLATDATFVADMAALTLGSGGTAASPKVLRSFRPLGSLGQEHFPCWVLEPGDDTTTGRAVGSCHQELEVEILLGLVWHQQDPTTAYNQRLQLRDALTALLLRNPSPDGQSTVYVDAQGNDRSANHPTHITTFRLLADVTITQ
jgi:hypothetical protein